MKKRISVLIALLLVICSVITPLAVQAADCETDCSCHQESSAYDYHCGDSCGEYCHACEHTHEHDGCCEHEYLCEDCQLEEAGCSTAGFKQETPEYFDEKSSCVGKAYQLVDSELAGPWQDWMEDVNCYAYAIGFNFAIEPGFFSGETYECSIFVDNGNTAAIANIVENDLKDHGYTCVTKTTICPNLNTLASDQNVICLKSTLVAPGVDTDHMDYHFMRYDKEQRTWLHKPGNKAVLKYKYSPHEKVWTNEYVNKYGTAHAPTIEYNSQIYYFVYSDNHNRVVTETNLAQHRLTCTSCGKSYWLSHNNDAYPYSSAKHKLVCSVCNRINYEEHMMTSYSQYSTLKHKRICSKCGHYAYENHNYTRATSNGPTHHRLICECGHYELEEHIPNSLGARCIKCNANLNDVPMPWSIDGIMIKLPTKTEN